MIPQSVLLPLHRSLIFPVRRIEMKHDPHFYAAPLLAAVRIIWIRESFQLDVDLFPGVPYPRHR